LNGTCICVPIQVEFGILLRYIRILLVFENIDFLVDFKQNGKLLVAVVGEVEFPVGYRELLVFLCVGVNPSIHLVRIEYHIVHLDFLDSVIIDIRELVEN